MKILLLGNGFDIFHGLPTKYQNFLHTVEFLKENYMDSMKTIGDIFSKMSCDKDICKSYQLCKKHYDKVYVDSQKINKLVFLSKKNMWFSYLYNSYNEDLNWIDFEKEIANVLREFEGFFKIHNSLSNKQIITISLSDEFRKT